MDTESGTTGRASLRGLNISYYPKISNISRTISPKLKCFSSRLAVVYVRFIETSSKVENENVVEQRRGGYYIRGSMAIAMLTTSITVKAMPVHSISMLLSLHNKNHVLWFPVPSLNFNIEKRLNSSSSAISCDIDSANIKISDIAQNIWFLLTHNFPDSTKVLNNLVCIRLKSFYDIWCLRYEYIIPAFLFNQIQGSLHCGCLIYKYRGINLSCCQGWQHIYQRIDPIR